MMFELLTDAQKEQYRTDILEMLRFSDREFVPPLSARSSTTQADLSGESASEDGVVPYFREMLKQQILGAFEDGVLLAFVSFRENYTYDSISAVCPNIYLSTLVMRPEARGKYLTVHMYEHLFFRLYPAQNVYTRTWSTNIPHITILGKFGFRVLCRLADDRGPGVDTVYFGLERN